MPDNKNSTPKETPGGFGIPADTYGLKDGAPSAESSFEQAKSKNNEKSHGDNYGLNKGASQGSGGPAQKKKEDLPHSKTVRGTLANTSGAKVNKTMLGDPASLTSETSNTKLGRDVERGDGAGKSKL
jgi:hypothetical protein